MKVYDIKRINDKSFSSQNFYIFFLKYILRDDVDLEKSLDVLRVSGVYIGNHSEQSHAEYNNNFDICINALLEKYPDNKELIFDFEEQCKIMHDINNAFFENISGRNVWCTHNSVSNDLRLNFILFSEIFLSTISAVSLRADLLNLKKTFPFFVLPINIAQADEFDIKTGFDFDLESEKTLNRAYDEVVSYTGKIYSFLRQPAPLKLNIKIDPKKTKTLVKYFNECNMLDSLERIIDLFKLNNARFTQSDENEYHCDVNNDCLYRDYEIARNRLMMRSGNLFNEARLTNINNINMIEEFKKTLPSYLTNDGIFSTIKLSELENSAPADLSEKYGNIPIHDWIHAYQCLIDLSTNLMRKRFTGKNKIALDSQSWLEIKSHNKWISFFEKKGLSRQTAKEIIKHFTFDSKAKDLNDCPFICCDTGLLLMPALVFRSSPVNSLMSLFGSKKIDTAIKGDFHERQFIQLVLESGIQACHIHAHEDYECDCLILIDDHLIFTELKSNGQPIRFEKYYQHICNTIGDDSFILDRKNKKMRSSKEQINRVANYYLENIKLITKKFGLADSWKPKGVYKMILSTTILGGIYHNNGVYIVDKFAMVSFFRRSPGKIYRSNDEMKGQIICGYEHCEGIITIDKFIAYIESLPSIAVVKKYMRKLTYNVKLGDLLIYYPYYDSWPTGAYVRKIDKD
ncbi:hypothetical protein [Pectobacterium brasiliense]|uniref:hypothetical protein n=1 Tax=Pectobacterium brasiliense TaxID=180957 RepID=UPI001CF12537|nr:hypothetical protein [Pectobacterium brasiliense]MCA6984751.1 hypothetical protein [Pectobacterium brasiliense]MCH4994284.1 hypothetical protein [Pectobacterium brasiliense]